MAEILGPYDPASPCLTTVCKRITTEEYEKQASETTETAIADLIRYLEYNPTAYHNILRKRKREDQENAGVLSWLKVKMLSKFLGDDYVEQINPDEAREKIKNLKEEMISVYNYGEDAKGSPRRFSRRIAQKKRLQSQNQGEKPGLLPDPQCSIAKNLERDLMENTSDSVNLSADATSESRTTLAPPMPPPPPPLPPLNFTSQNEGRTSKEPFSEIQNKMIGPTGSGKAKAMSPSRINTRSQSKEMKENICGEKEGSLEQLLSSIKNPNIRAKLRPVNIGCTDESPYQIRQRINKLKSDAEKEFPLFNQQLINKFQNARSPKSPQYLSDVSPSGSFNLSP